jgi:L-fucose isomerase
MVNRNNLWGYEMDIIVRERLIGALPRIGIRPVVDGRIGGAREAREKETMAIAHKAAEFISANVRYPNGMPVECTVSSICIGGVAEAQMCADEFSRKNVGATLTISWSWCYGTEVMDMDSLIPKAIWGINGTDVGGAVYLACATAAHDQKGLPAFKIYSAEVQDRDDHEIPGDVKPKLILFARAATAVAYMRGKSYLSIGGVCMGIAGSIVNEDFFMEYLNMRNESVDMVEVIRRIERKIYDEEEYKLALAWVKKYCLEGEDENLEANRLSRASKDRAWETSVLITLIIRDLMVGNPALKEKGFSEEALGHNAIAAGFQGQRHWTDHYPVSDFAEVILNSTFDWTGLRQPYIIATENDSLNAASMLFAHLVTNGKPQIYADIRTYISPQTALRITGKALTGRAAGGVIHLKNSGPAILEGTGEERDEKGGAVIKAFYEATEADANACLKATSWKPADAVSFRAGGYSSCWRTRAEMPVTMLRLNIVKGIGPTLQIAEGYTVNLPDDISDEIDNRTNPTWPTTWFVPNLMPSGPFRSVFSVMEKWGANHGAISYGHIGAELITLASMLRIPVVLHNIEEERIFRPTTWDAFGAMSLQEADLRASRSYGPLYR